MLADKAIKSVSPLDAVRSYRRELDGVRALAVLAVLFFHAGFGWMRGGYLGVDIFLVLSGFLIIGQILERVEQRTFSFREFYIRRFRRIMPALFTLVAVTLLVGSIISVPSDLAELAASALAAVSSVSNIFFWFQSGYFDSAAEYKPLLHTWSLSLEEQMYVILPIVIVGASRWAKAPVGGAIAPAAAAFFVTAIVAGELYPSASFFLLPTRAWEFLVGGAVAYWVRGRSVRVAPSMLKGYSDLLAVSGLLLIVVSSVWLGPNEVSPVLSAVPVVAGTCLLLAFASPSTITGRFLSLRPLVLIGLASYSIYLWHQPIFAFARQYFGSHISMGSGVVFSLLAVAIAAGFASWRIIEIPYRDPSRRSSHQLLRYSLLFLVPSVAASSYFADESRATVFTPNHVVDLAKPARADPFNCRLSAKGVDTGESCLFGEGLAVPIVAVVGDSHARRLTGALAVELNARGMSAHLFADSWCVPVPGIYTADRTRNPSCSQFIDAVFRRLIESDVKVVVLAAQWPAYVDGWRTGDQVPTKYVSESYAMSPAPHLLFGRELGRLVRRLESRGKHVVVVMTVPEYLIDVPAALSRRAKHSGYAHLLGPEMVEAARYEKRNASTRMMLSVAGVAEGAIIETTPSLCPDEYCMVMFNGEALYEDSSHLSYAGARLIAPEVMRYIEAHVPRRTEN